VDSVDFGVIACERSVPHVWDIALGFGAAVADLFKIALEQTSKTPTLRGEGAAWAPARADALLGPERT